MSPASALTNRDRARSDRPAWVADGRPAGEPLRRLTVQALAQPLTPATRLRLRDLDRPPLGVRWTADDDAWRDAGAAIRRETLADLPGYLDRLTRAIEARGGTVHRAATDADACAIIERIARDHDVRLVTKTKSMATEEIGLNRHLESRGLEVVETDLGEHIIQLRDERPSQLVGPALHLSADDVAEVFSAVGEPVAAEPEPLAGSARARLRPDFRDAEMGVIGVNFAASDTGTLVVVTSEGNADLVTTHPSVLVALMGIDKVIPRLADIGVLVPLLCRAAGDDYVTAYQTLITGPRDPGEADGPAELHVVLLDNGREAMLGTPYAEALACIRCGNCQMSCPVFKAIGGGHGYGTVYGGPIGAVLSPLLGDPDTDTDVPFLSSLCGACGDACPVRIPLPDLLVQLRARHCDGRTDAAARVERTGWGLFARAWSRPALYRASVAAARLAGRLVPRRLLAALPIARSWATGRRLPHLEKAGAWQRHLRRNRTEDRS